MRVDADSPSAAEATLRKAGLRRTPVRVGVLEVLEKAGRPMSVPQILGKLRNVDSVTVYRTLNTFTRKSMVHRVRGEDRTWLFALSDAGGQPAHRHPHFVCERCGRVECIEQANLPRRLIQKIGVDDSYNVRYAEVILHGICPRCAAKQG